MPEHHKPAPSPGLIAWQVPWQVPVALDDVAEEGQRFDLAADADTRAAVARIAGLRDLPRLEAVFDVDAVMAKGACAWPVEFRRRSVSHAWSRWSRSPMR